MAQTGLATFDTTLDKTNHVLKEIETAFGWPKERRNQSYAALRAVLHALRDRMTVDETAQLSAQLPMLIRGIYFEGWDPTHVPMKVDRDEFLARVEKEYAHDMEGDVVQLTQTVLQALRAHVSDGEWDDIRSAVPKKLASVLP
ncbi:MAG: hypothetical protein QOE19_3023 [Actinomycetota bacterium]|jgi:uncharacterized protein (DUF2267 family)|nr:hypothetical protein [Actinomycetota bacterium]